jgi:hypothetical protein
MRMKRSSEARFLINRICQTILSDLVCGLLIVASQVGPIAYEEGFATAVAVQGERLTLSIFPIGTC